MGALSNGDLSMSRMAETYRHQRFRRLDQRVVSSAELGLVQRMIGRFVGASPRLLDVPCGAGRLWPAFAAIDADAVGVDILPGMVTGLTSTRPGARALVGSANFLPFAGELFDVVVCMRHFHHSWTWVVRDDFLGELARVSRRHVLVSLYTPCLAHTLEKGLLGRVKRRPKKTTLRFTRRSEIEAAARDNGLRVIAVRRPLPYIHAQTLVMMEKR